ncbi:Outer membrane receptor for ferrienterochelin and colicins [Pseudarcicella hirudinis]|uniref:Outer membrane receptor for ferrienterochelin and colicins n=1 Tax=Pseudarcicella hirudinis TaxID=1079859 RepID=A0A1I5V1M5_9BACT|nr:outer membrane beta-barrel family protein [Pseudarcicella hirudinis]SFQ01403.1 Outer membrane receptor for ferrienterochelin and colicins [Pseudarcicella hirudinis]
MKKIIFILFFISIQFAKAQTPSESPNKPPVVPMPKGNSKISGYVIDSAATKAVEFANIALFSKITNKPVDGTVADEKGAFSLNRIAAGDYKILISFIGFSQKTIDNVRIEKGKDLDLGIIKLASTFKQLDEVTVTAQKAVIEEKVDRLVYNAERDISSKGGDASDVLKKVPMLSVDLNGNLSLQGNSNILVLINNKPSSIMAGSIADALKQIPADMIKSIEVITSPSAKYDAEGAGGIVNIITKKNTLQGLNLNVDGGLGNRSSTFGLNGNYRKGKLGFNVGGNGRFIYNKAFTDLEQSTELNGNTIRTSQKADAFDHGFFGQYSFGFDYDIAKNQSLTGNARFGIRNFNRDQNQTTYLYTNDVESSASKRDVYSKDLSNSVDLNIDYVRTFKPQQEWTISTQYSQNNLTNNFDANILNQGGDLTGRQRNINLNTNKEFTLQTDYTTPINEHQSLEFGAKGIFRQVNSNYQYLLSAPGSDYVIDPKRPTGFLDYAQNIGAGYLSYTLQTSNNYTFKVGSRYEYTHIKANTGESKIDIPAYGFLVPSVNISKKTGESSTLKLSYNRRIQRPGLQQLNPNFNAANPQNITKGNPNLKPEITDKVELGYSTYIKKTYLSLTLFSRLNRDDIQQMSQRSDTVAGAVITTFQNIGKEDNYGTNLYATINITPKWSVSANFDAMYRYIEGLAPDLEGKSITVSNTGWSFGGRLDSQAQLGNGWAVQGNFGTRGKRVQLQGSQTGFIMYSLGFRKEFNQKKGTLGLAAENFLTNGMSFNSELNSVQFKQIYNQQIYNSTIKLTFSYKIGKMSVSEKKKKSARGEEESE